MRIDSYGLEAFLAITRYGTLSRAATHLHISQSAISQRIRALEESLKVTLIDRGRGRSTIALTAAGENLMSLAERWEILKHELNTTALGGLPTINVGAPPSVNDFVLAPLYSAVSERGHLRVQVQTANSPSLYERLERRELDIAFALHMQRMTGVVIRPVLREKLVLVTKTDLPLAQGLLDTASLDPHNQVYLQYGADYDNWHRKWFGSVRRSAILVDNIHLVVSFLNAKERWAIVPRSVARSFQKQHKTRVYTFRNPPPDRILYLAKLRELSSSSQEGCLLLEKLFQEVSLEGIRESA